MRGLVGVIDPQHQRFGIGARPMICSEVGNPPAANPFGTAAAQRSRKLTHRVNVAGVEFWSIEATGMAGVTAVGVSSASTPSIVALNDTFSRSRSASAAR